MLIATAIAALDARAQPRPAPPPHDHRSAPAHLDAERRRADRLAALVRRGGAAPAHEVDEVIGALEALQRGGRVEPRAELRAMAAAWRLLEAVDRRDGGGVPRPSWDRVEALVARARYRTEVGHHETAVELEGAFTEVVLDALTTDDGTVGPVFGRGRGRGKAPDWLRRLADGRPLRSVGWDELSRSQKRELLRLAAGGRDFFADRRIRGLRFRPGGSPAAGDAPTPALPALPSWIALNPWLAYHPLVLSHRLLAGTPWLEAHPIFAFGRLFAPRPATPAGVGPELADKLVEDVYYQGPASMRSLAEVEVHVRQPGRASANAADAFEIAGRFGTGSGAAHQHVPGRLPHRVRLGDPLDRFRLVDFWRRANVVAELQIVLDGYVLVPREDETTVYFDFLKADMLVALNRHLYRLAGRGRGTLAHDDLKMAAVGFRTGELYGDRTMFGLEDRTLQAGSTAAHFADALQRAVLTGSYGLSRRSLSAWLDARVPAGARPEVLRRQNRLLARLHYNRPLAELLRDAPAALAPELALPDVRARLAELAEQHYGLKMLVHDWSLDPVLDDRHDLLARVLGAQRAGLRALAAGDRPDRVVAAFVRSSALHEPFAASLGEPP